jgi:hypothetical protein
MEHRSATPSHASPLGMPSIELTTIGSITCVNRIRWFMAYKFYVCLVRDSNPSLLVWQPALQTIGPPLSRITLIFLRFN